MEVDEATGRDAEERGEESGSQGYSQGPRCDAQYLPVHGGQEVEGFKEALDEFVQCLLPPGWVGSREGTFLPCGATHLSALPPGYGDKEGSAIFFEAVFPDQVLYFL